jgi:hypothetical protein
MDRRGDARQEGGKPRLALDERKRRDVLAVDM